MSACLFQISLRAAFPNGCSRLVPFISTDTTKRATSSVRSYRPAYITYSNILYTYMLIIHSLFYCVLVWFKVKLHMKDNKTITDKKKYVAFWLERYAKKEPGMPLTVVFDMAESGLSNIVSP